MSSDFSRALVEIMRRLYPESTADKTFDNTGLLLEAPFNPQSGLKSKVLLTIDLTKAVAEEAIRKKCGAIVCYHPIIFRALKSLTLANSQQNSILRLAAQGISVYSPHTAVDAAVGGNADWLADIVTGEILPSGPGSLHSRPTPPSRSPISNLDYELHTFPSSLEHTPNELILGRVPHDRCPIVPNSLVKGAGMGRIVRFKERQMFAQILKRITAYFGNPASVSVAVPQEANANTMQIASIGICAGSGGSLLGDVDVDVLLTGELSHHEALAATESGKCVIVLNHSNSERGYLAEVMQAKLRDALQHWYQSNPAASQHEDISVEVSEKDRDPFQSLIRVMNDTP